MEPPTAFNADRAARREAQGAGGDRAADGRRGRRDVGPRPVHPRRRRRRAGPGLPRGARRRAGLAHPDLRGAAAARLQLALGRRPVLPADRQAPGPQADRDRGDPQAGPAPRLPELGLGRHPGQPDHAHGPARRGRVGVARGQDPRAADADPAGQHGVPLRDLVPVGVARGLRAADPRRDARRRDAVHAQRRDRGAVGDHRPDPRGLARTRAPVAHYAAGSAGPRRPTSCWARATELAAAVRSEDVWSEHDTTPDAIEAALRELLRERHAANERARARAGAEPGRDRRPRVEGRDRQPARARRPLPRLAHRAVRGRAGPHTIDASPRSARRARRRASA